MNALEKISNIIILFDLSYYASISADTDADGNTYYNFEPTTPDASNNKKMAKKQKRKQKPQNQSNGTQEVRKSEYA